MAFRVQHRGAPLGVFRIAMPGAHNVKNALAALAIATAAGVEAETAREGLAAFAGVKRRLETVGSARGVTVLDDFAHHPTAVRETLAAVRPRIPPRASGPSSSPGRPLRAGASSRTRSPRPSRRPTRS